jgi:hypothetical protein
MNQLAIEITSQPRRKLFISKPDILAHRAGLFGTKGISDQK